MIARKWVKKIKINRRRLPRDSLRLPRLEEFKGIAGDALFLVRSF